MHGSTPDSGAPGTAIAPVVLLAAATGLALQCLRVLFPLVYGVYERGGVTPAAMLSAAVFAAPALALVVPRGRAGTWSIVGGAVAGRIAIQLARPAPLWLVALAAAVALIALTRALDLAGPALAIGVSLGVALDAFTRAVFTTWDPAFRDGTLALATALAWAGAAAWGAGRARARAGGASIRTWALGPALVLTVLFLANPATVASQASLGAATAAGVTLAGCTVAVAGTVIGPGRRIAVGMAAITLTIGAAGLSDVTGRAWIPVLLAVQAAWGVALAAVAADEPDRSRLGGPIGTAAGTLAFGAILFAYQLDVEQPLPAARWILPAAAGLLLGAAAVRATVRGDVTSAAPVERRSLSWIALPAAATLAVPLGISATAPTIVTTRPDVTTVRILDWNVHGGVDADGRVDPAGIANTIAAQDPDVVVLQEVARGWPIHGEVDLAAWLSRTLAMPYRWAPAADGQFGNVVLSRLDIRGWETLELPYAGGPQHRSSLRVTLDAGNGRTLTVIGVHLQHRTGSDVGRVQATELIRAWIGHPATVLAGDLNAQPGDPAAASILEAGLVSAQDTVGDPQTSTARDPLLPVDRVDWTFASPDLFITSFHVIPSDASDHLPLVTTIRLP